MGIWVRVWFDGSVAAGGSGFGCWAEVTAPECPQSWRVLALQSSPGEAGTDSLQAETLGAKAAVQLMEAIGNGRVEDWCRLVGGNGRVVEWSQSVAT